MIYFSSNIFVGVAFVINILLVSSLNREDLTFQLSYHT